LPRKWFKKWLPKKDFLKDTFVYRIFGERLFHRELWHISRHSLAGGLALGLFLACTPTIPFHMVLAALFAIFLRVNLPVAVITCWVNNPLTMFFIYTSSLKMGQFLAGDSGSVLQVRQFGESWESFYKYTSYLWTGSLVLGTIVALAGYLAVRIIWRYLVVRRWKERKH